MIQNTLKNARYVAAAGAVFAILFMGFSHTASATVTYYWASNPTYPPTNIYPTFAAYGCTGTDGRCWTQTMLISAATFDGGFSSLNNVNFIDVRMKKWSGNNVPLYLWICNESNVAAQCSVANTIATSSPFTSNDIQTDGDWFRIYFDEAWSSEWGIGGYLKIQMGGLSGTGDKTGAAMYEAQDLYLDGFSSKSYALYNHYGGPIRFGYDSGYEISDTTYHVDTDILPAYTYCNFLISSTFILSDNDISTYEEFHADISLYETPLDGPNAGIKRTVGISYPINKTTGAGSFEYNCEYEGSAALIEISGANTSRLLYGTDIDGTPDVTNALLSFSTINAFIVGTTTATVNESQDVAEPYYITDFNDPFGENATSTNMEECRFGGNWARCFFGLIVPSTEQMQDSISRATSTIFIIPPLSWIISVGTILVKPLDSHATGTLPNFNITIPEGVPGAGAGVDLTPWNHLKTFWESEWNSNDIYEFETASTTGEIIEPRINEIAKYMFALWLFGLLIVIRL